MGALTELLISQQGYVRLAHLASGVHIELCADRLSQAAYASVIHWLADNPQSRVSLAVRRGTAHAEITSLPAEVKRQLAACIQDSRSRAAPRLHRLPISPSALAAASPLRILRQLWQHGVDPGEPGFASACDRLFRGRYILTERTGSGDLVIREHGGGYIAYSNAYLSRCVGLRIEDDPDMEYGLWTREAYREALRDWRPLVEDVDVAIHGAREVGRHVRYQRIIAPLTGRGGSTFLFSASVLASTLPLETDKI